MTTFTAPPDQTDLVLNIGDILDVNSGGTATGTTISFGGIENVNGGGTATDTTIKALGIENVREGGTATDTSISRGGTENVDPGGIANGTIINGGTENVSRGGTATGTIINDGHEFVSGIANGTIINQFGFEHVRGISNNTTINNGGVEHVDAFGTANNVIFAGSRSVLELANPSGLKGTISDWHVSDVIDFLNTSVTSVHENETETTLTVNYVGRNGHNQIATYSLVGQQANTAFELHSDGRGGTDLILTPITGVQPLHSEAGHFLV